MIYWFDTLDSTNSYAREHISGFDNLSVVAAKCQMKGRGQGDHSWTSDPGKNMTFTVILKPDGDFTIEAKDAILITHIATSAIRRFLRGYGIETAVKWPNDIYVGDRKICGILIENILKGKIVECSMIGVGINLNQDCFPPDLPNPVSVLQLTGKKHRIEDAVERIADCFSAAFAESGTPADRDSLKREFDNCVFFRQ